MAEDPALMLKKRFDSGEKITKKQARKMLLESELINKLLVDPKQRPDTFVGARAYEWRLLELTEIPYTYLLEKVQKWLDLLQEKTSIPEGFSLTGEQEGLLACHNSMITTILIKMECDAKERIDSGVKWILSYQSVERNKECNWTGADLFTKFGGCMKKNPCYYGVVKSMITLTEFKNRYGSSKKLDDKLNKGLEYILSHNVFKRLSSGKPIEPSIIENFYPFTYKSNIIEILSLLKANDRLRDERCIEAVKILKEKQRPDGFWQADTSYMKSAWIDFDIPKKPGPWISYKINSLVNG